MTTTKPGFLGEKMAVAPLLGLDILKASTQPMLTVSESNLELL
jgi:hypothetical protein